MKSATAVTGALRARGVAEPAATLAAQSCVTVFGVAFSRWTADGEERSLLEVEREVVGELTGLFGGERGQGPEPDRRGSTRRAPVLGSPG